MHKHDEIFITYSCFCFFMFEEAETVHIKDLTRINFKKMMVN